MVDVSEVSMVGGGNGALLGVARRFAAMADPADVVEALVAEAVRLVGADDGAVAPWDDEISLLRVERVHRLRAAVGDEAHVADGGALARAVRQMRPVVTIDRSAESPISVAAAPIAYEGRLFGALAVSRSRARPAFAAAELSALEELAGAAAATLVGIERSRLAGAQIAADTAAHELSGYLQVTVGQISLLVEMPGLDAEQRMAAEAAMAGAESAASVLSRLRRLTRLHVRSCGRLLPPTIDLDRSTGGPRT